MNDPRTYLLKRSCNYPVHVEAEYLYRPFRKEWFSMAVVDTSAYYILLANASLYMNSIITHGGWEYSDCQESSEYYRTCLTTMSKRLGSQTERSSEGVITTILGFLCHDVSGITDIAIFP